MRLATEAEHHYATYTAKASYCRALSLRVDDRRNQAPKIEISTITFVSAEAGITNRVIRSSDLAIYNTDGSLSVVVRTELRDAREIAKRIQDAHAIAGFGSPEVLNISVSSF